MNLNSNYDDEDTDYGENINSYIETQQYEIKDEDTDYGENINSYIETQQYEIKDDRNRIYRDPSEMYGINCIEIDEQNKPSEWDKNKPSVWDKIKIFFLKLAQREGVTWTILKIFVDTIVPSLTGPFYLIVQVMVNGIVSWIKAKMDQKLAELLDISSYN